MKTTIDVWQKAGNISAQARDYGRELCVIGASALDIVEKVEQKIRQLGGKPSFPVDISLNQMAAHVSPHPHDPLKLQKGDIVKLDLGAHVDGYVTDTEITVEVGSNKNLKLIKAAEDALQAAIDVVKPGVKLCQIGAAISEVIRGAGFNPITNLSGHGVGQWIVHDAPSIPNYNNGDQTKLVEGQKIAIEPFATTGEGKVKDGKPSGIYGLVHLKPVRLDSARKMIQFIQKEYQTLPFCLRWVNHLPNAKFILAYLEKEGVIHQYPELVERTGGLVSQKEHTLSVGRGVLTK
ncbi:MAG: type II methionyl aminopeptidase [Nanoarchaeota archaeon]